MMRGVRHRHFIAAIICILGLLITLFKVHSTPQPISTMGITTRFSITKDKLTSRATTITATTPKERQSGQLAQSPRSGRVNSLIAKINLPRA
jgi:hypothetical protein